jgi:hypothetical protein
MGIRNDSSEKLQAEIWEGRERGREKRKIYTNFKKLFFFLALYKSHTNCKVSLYIPIGMINI